jgi:monoamine oxidase
MAVGFLSARYAENAKVYDHDTLIKMFLAQLEEVFSHMKPQHMVADPEDESEGSSAQPSLIVPKLSTAFVKGIVYDWADNHPYVGGAYASPKAGKPIDYPEVLAKPINNSLFFAGEATNTDAGACTHSALETGVRVAEEIYASILLDKTSSK